jgi:hypothetical protein
MQTYFLSQAVENRTSNICLGYMAVGIVVLCLAAYDARVGNGYQTLPKPSSLSPTRPANAALK